jgi:N-acylneuraminate cytidylyltransferase
MANLAIIPARGGSKRIPRKNINDFLGKPIIAYSIEAAIKSQLFSEVMVSTDDFEIADMAIQLGAKVPFMRSNEMADDYATTFGVITEVIQEYKKNGKLFENACCIYPTAPLIKTSQLAEGLRQLMDKKLNSVFPVVSFSYPVWRGFYVEDDGKSKMVWPEYLHVRSQDLKTVYHDAGQWYWFKTDIERSLFTEHSGVVILSEEEVQDIDTVSDWKLAELKYKLLFGS